MLAGSSVVVVKGRIIGWCGELSVINFVVVHGICFDELHGALQGLKSIGGLRVRVFVGVQLNRQFAVKLGQEGRGGLLHSAHACNEHVLGRAQDLVNHVGLLLSDDSRKVGGGVFTQELLG